MIHFDWILKYQFFPAQNFEDAQTFLKIAICFVRYSTRILEGSPDVNLKSKITPLPTQMLLCLIP